MFLHHKKRNVVLLYCVELSHSSILIETVKFMISKNVNNPLLACTITLKLHSVLRLKTRRCNIVHYRQYIASNSGGQELGSVLAIKHHNL